MKKVNPKVMNVIDTYVNHALSGFLFLNDAFVLRVEKKETEAEKMLTTVLKDKEKIEVMIEELARYKRDALEKP